MELRLSGATLDANGLTDWWHESLPDTSAADEPTPDQNEDTDDDAPIDFIAVDN